MENTNLFGLYCVPGHEVRGGQGAWNPPSWGAYSPNGEFQFNTQEEAKAWLQKELQA